MKGKNLYEKLAMVGQQIGAVPKLGFNDFQKYAYATEADMKRAVRKAFFDQGLCLVPEIIKRENYESQNDRGKTTHFTDLEVKFTVYDTESKEFVTASICGTGSDTGDKAVWKAYAGLLKYFLATTFMIPTGDDPEEEQSETGPSLQCVWEMAKRERGITTAAQMAELLTEAGVKEPWAQEISQGALKQIVAYIDKQKAQKNDVRG